MLFLLKKFVSFWLMPLPFCVTVLAVGAILLWRSRWLRLGRALVVGGVLLLMTFANPLVSRALLRPLETRYPSIPEFRAGTPLPAEVAACRFVVVLGGGNGFSPGMPAINELSPSALSRLTEGVRLLRVLPEARLIVSGANAPGQPTHASILAAAAESLGIAPERIIRVDQAHDTEDEANLIREIAAGQPLALVTSAWHLPRAVALFRGVGLKPLPCPADLRTHAENDFNFMQLLWDADALTQSTYAVRERIGALWITLRGKSG